MLLERSVNAVGFEKWLEQWLSLDLRSNSTLIYEDLVIRLFR